MCNVAAPTVAGIAVTALTQGVDGGGATRGSVLVDMITKIRERTLERCRARSGRVSVDP
jgi:hypothetical protein